MTLPRTTVHRDGTVTYWSVYRQQWVHRARVIDHQELAAMAPAERRRVLRSYAVQVGCACGRLTDAACPWYGPARDTVVVEWMPEWLRESHRAAGNSGVYPHNGAIRVRVSRQCAADLAGEWCEIVGS